MTVSAAADRWVAGRRENPGRVLVAISGGADSVALAYALTESVRQRGFVASDHLALAHYNHNTRPPAEHATDLELVRCVSRETRLPCVFGAAPREAVRHLSREQGGIESAARSMRHQFFTEAAVLIGADAVCTAHTADDQAETVLMRLMEGKRGTLLAGIPARRILCGSVTLERPLLDVRRSEIEAHLNGRGYRWMNDSTNEHLVYRRNLVRREILPSVELIWSAARQDLLLLAHAWTRRIEAIRERADSVRIEFADGEARFSREAFFALDRESRLELLYGVLVHLRLFDRRDRPGHRFFEPLLGADPGGRRVFVASRRIRIAARGALLRVGRDCPGR